MDSISIEIPQFITHVKLSRNKYVKISGQAIYSGMNHHLRAVIVRKMHEYIKQYVPVNLFLTTPIQIRLEFHVPINYDTVRKIKNLADISWKPPKDGYEPKWDADNQWVWGKCFNDVLVELGIIKDDNVSIVRSSGKVEFKEVKTIDERKLVFVIEPYQDEINTNQ